MSYDEPGVFLNLGPQVYQEPDSGQIPSPTKTIKPKKTEKQEENQASIDNLIQKSFEAMKNVAAECNI
jgi:hypothetical protein